MAAASALVEVRNPATGELVAAVPEASAAEVHAMAERARAAQPAWEALGFEGRGRVLRRARKWLVDNAERVSETIVAESGKPFDDAQLTEVTYGIIALGFWAKRAPRYLADERVRAATPFVAGRRLVVSYRPMGVVGVIGPWNYPLNNTFGDAVPALAAGNAVLLKPSEMTPLTSLLLAEGLRESGVPRDVVQVAVGGPGVGEALVDAADMIMFTGSTGVGRSVMARAARTLTPVSLELGGKDPMIVLADADLERAANAAAYYGLHNSGQACISVERIYVEAPVHDAFVARLTEKVRALRQGAPDGPGSVDVGAVTHAPQLDVIRRHVEEARAAGAQVLTGGRARTDRGRFFEPTVLAGVDHSMAAMTEETFGPTLPVMRVADAEEAVRLANDSVYGLGASVWTRDRRRGERLARRLQSGFACINDAGLNYFALELPMGGWKASGLGVRHGADGIRKYTRRQSLFVTRVALGKRDLHMFPYRARTTRLIARALRLAYGRAPRN